MDLRQIRTFAYVAEHKSFSKAAKILNIAQPAVSRQIQSLEQELQTHLLFRNTRGVELTESGRILLSLGSEILAMADRLKEVLINNDDKARGEVTIGILPSVMAFFTTPLLEECRRTFPDVTIHVEEGLDALLKEWLAVGRIDLAIMTDRGTDREFVQTRLAREELVLVSDPTRVTTDESPVSASNLSAIPIIIGRGFQERIDPILAVSSITIPYIQILDNIKMIRELIGRSPYYTILTREIVRREVLEGTLKIRRIVDPPLMRVLLLARDPRRPATLAMKAVSDLLARHARNLL